MLWSLFVKPGLMRHPTLRVEPEISAGSAPRIDSWNRARLFSWCEEVGLDSHDLIAATLHLSVATLSTWRLDPAGSILPRVIACIDGYEAWRGAGLGERVDLPPASREWLEKWMNRLEIPTISRFAGELGYPRQRVADWFSDGSAPPWLGLACMGIEARKRGLIRGAKE